MPMRVLPVGEKQNKYAGEVAEKLKDDGFRVTADIRNETLGYRIRQAQKEKVNYMLIVGEKEMKNGLVNVRSRDGKQLGERNISTLVGELDKELVY